MNEEWFTATSRGYVFYADLYSPVLFCLSVKANILVDQTGNARLADFGLLAVISDAANLSPSSSYAHGGTARWMSPERISPQDFGLKTSRPSKSSDCYSLGMVIYETISGNLPFHEDRGLTIFVKVLRGERPRREDGFANSLWDMLEWCWMARPSDRPNVEDVLQCLETCSNRTAEGMERDLGLEGRVFPPGQPRDYSSPDDDDNPAGQFSGLGFDKNNFPSPLPHEQNTLPAPSPFPLLALSDVVPLLGAENLHPGTPLENTQRVTSDPQPYNIPETLAPRRMLPTVQLKVDNRGESMFLSIFVPLHLHPTHPFLPFVSQPQIQRGAQKQNSTIPPRLTLVSIIHDRLRSATITPNRPPGIPKVYGS